MKRNSKEKIVKSKFVLRETKKTKLFKVVIFIMPVFTISVLAFGIVVPLHKFDKEDSAMALSRNECSSEADLDKLLIVVGADNVLPSSYKVDVGTFNGVKCDRIIITNLKKMFVDAENQGMKLKVIDGYVSSEEQQKKYDSEIEKVSNDKHTSKSRSKIEVEKYFSPPGRDEHQTGLSINIVDERESSDFTLTEEYRWLQKNAANYGFVVRYPMGKVKESFTKKSFDPTLFRYVGTENAQKMRIMNMCLEEYVAYINER